MVNYCIDKKTCKRKLIARHFNDNVWENKGECNQMCDFCKDLIANKIEKIDAYEESCFVMSLLENPKSDKKLTSNKLAELVNSEIMSKNKKSKYYPNNLNQYEVENLILTMLMNSYLKEDFHFTPYNTICYIVPGPLSKHLRNDSYFYIERTISHNSKNLSIEKVEKIEKAEKDESKELRTRKRNLDLNTSSDSCELNFDQSNSDMPKSKKTLW